MEKIIKQLSVLGVAGAMALNLGCDLDEANPTGPNFAPLSLDGKVVIFTGIETDSDNGISVEGATANFAASTVAVLYVDGGTETLGYNYQPSGTTGSINVTEPDGSGTFTLLLIFTSPTRGNYTINDTGGGSEHGVFQQTN